MTFVILTFNLSYVFILQRTLSSPKKFVKTKNILSYLSQFVVIASKFPLNGTHFEDQKMILFCHKTVFFVSRENEKTEMARNTRCKWLLLLPESP